MTVIHCAHKTCGYDVAEIIAAQVNGTLGLNDQHCKTLDTKVSINLEHLINNNLGFGPVYRSRDLTFAIKAVLE